MMGLVGEAMPATLTVNGFKVKFRNDNLNLTRVYLKLACLCVLSGNKQFWSTEEPEAKTISKYWDLVLAICSNCKKLSRAFVNECWSCGDWYYGPGAEETCKECLN